MSGHSARNTAMDLLARRDHSRQQLFTKLEQRGFDREEIEAALDHLKQDRLQDDERFAESYLYQRVQKGFGPLRIHQELKDKGISDDIIRMQLEKCPLDWDEQMQAQRIKRFSSEIPDDFKERAKQARFLQNRGFSPEAVMRLFRR